MDPRNDEVFYVGKGKGNRPAQHVKAAIKGIRTAKCARIRDILDARLQVRVIFVREFKTEKAAYAYERKHIDRIGLENLTNMQPGGPATWVTKADPDLQMLSVIALFAKKTKGLRDGVYRWRCCGEWFVLPDTFLVGLRKRLDAIQASRGYEWTAKVLAAHKVTLRPAAVLRAGL